MILRGTQEANNERWSRDAAHDRTSSRSRCFFFTLSRQRSPRSTLTDALDNRHANFFFKGRPRPPVTLGDVRGRRLPPIPWYQTRADLPVTLRPISALSQKNSESRARAGAGQCHARSRCSRSLRSWPRQTSRRRNSGGASQVEGDDRKTAPRTPSRANAAGLVKTAVDYHFDGRHHEVTPRVNSGGRAGFFD